MTSIVSHFRMTWQPDAGAAAAPAHLTINVSYDSSVTGLQTTDPSLYADYTGAIQAAVRFYENEFTNPITINISFGWGEVDGTPITSFAGQSHTNSGHTFTYAQVYAAARAAETTSAVQLAAIASLPASDPTGGATFLVNSATAKALGLIGASGTTDGYVGLNSSDTYTWAEPDIASGTRDAVGLLEHEISEVMGRSDDISPATDYTLLDMFRYTAADGLATDAPGSPAGARDEPFVAGYSANAYSYFSYDGKTVTLPYDTPAQLAAGDDIADWTNSVTGDAFSEFDGVGDYGQISAADLDEMNVLGYDLVGPSFPTVMTAYQAILRTPPGADQASQIAAGIDTGQSTLALFETGLIASEPALYTTIAALVTIDAFYAATPSSANLTTVSTALSGTSYYTAAELHDLGYSDTNVWTVLASGWGADPGSAFYALYDADATGTTAGYTAFLNAVYAREFGAAPSAANLGNLLADVPGTQELLNGGGHVATPVQVMAGLYGYLLEVGQTYGIGQYAAATTEFLKAAANGTVTYGPELTAEFPAGASRQMAAADPNGITIIAPDQLIDPGTGGHSIQFLTGASGDAVVLDLGGVDRIAGFDPATDVLDLRSLLSGTGLNLNAGATALGHYLTIVDQGPDALLRFDPAGHGGGATVAVLSGLGGTVTGLDTLLARGAVRVG